MNFGGKNAIAHSIFAANEMKRKKGAAAMMRIN